MAILLVTPGGRSGQLLDLPLESLDFDPPESVDLLSLFVVLFGWDRWLSVLVGGGIVLAYSVLGGMWSITLADMAQFLIMTIGLFALMLPLSLANAGGWRAMQERLGAEFFSWDGIGVQSIVTYFVIYTLGLLIGQDVWQRVFTARSPRVAQIGAEGYL